MLPPQALPRQWPLSFQCTFGAGACAGPLTSTRGVSLQLAIKPQGDAGGRGDLILQETRLCVFSTLHPTPAPPKPHSTSRAWL